MTNVKILGVFTMHAQKEYGKVLEMEEHSYPEHFFNTSNAFTQSLV